MANIVLVEDNHALRQSLADYLGVQGHTVSEAKNAAELYGLMMDTRFDVAVVDINLPHHDGYSITSRLSQTGECAVIITTVREAVEDRVRGYQSGADIYMVKPVEPMELEAAIRRLSTKKTEPAAPLPLRKSGWSLDSVAKRLWAPDGTSIPLTKREIYALERIASTPGQIVKREQLVSGGTGSGGESSRRARADSLVSRLRRKVLKENGETLPLVTLHNNGVGFVEPLHLL